MKKILTVAILFSFNIICCFAERTLTFDELIKIAQESSYQAGLAKSDYEAAFWKYRIYKAGQKPNLMLNLTPTEYNRNVTKRYVSEYDRDEYRSQRSLYSYGQLNLKQAVSFTGGYLYMSSDFGFLRVFNENIYNQYTTTPFKIGYSQGLIGYNPFKWDHRIEPLKYNLAIKEYYYSREEIVYNTAIYYLNVVEAKDNLETADKNLERADTLYELGKIRLEHEAISRAYFTSLELLKMQQEDNYIAAKNNLEISFIALKNYLGMDKTEIFDVVAPSQIKFKLINEEEVFDLCKKNNPKFLELSSEELNAQKALDMAKKKRYLESSLDMSLGFNQYSYKFSDVYNYPMRQDFVSISLIIPIVDWGARKGAVQIAKQNYESINEKNKITISDLRLKLFTTTFNYNSQQSVLQNSIKAIEMSEYIFDNTKKRFIKGDCSIQEVQDALINVRTSKSKYISALKEFWLLYYELRHITLYDFINDRTLCNG